MKWPLSLMLIRHAESAYNILRKKKSENKIFKRFLMEYELNPCSDATVELAKLVREEFIEEPAMNVGDANTPLIHVECEKTRAVGAALRKEYPLPDVIFVSPYKRTWDTLKNLIVAWPELKKVKIVEEDLIREQEHGEVIMYPDWKVYLSLHPEQKKLYDREGQYYYRYPQGESVPDVRLRNRMFISTLTRDYAGKKVMVVTHHLTILAMRANLERLSAKQFLELDEKQKPINGGVTLYEGNPNQGSDGRLKLTFYNKKYY